MRDALPLFRVARQADAVEMADAEAFVHAHQQALFRFAYSIIEDADEAHDITQETLVSALNSFERYRGESAFRTWLFAIALNHCRKHLARPRSGERLLGLLQAVFHIRAEPPERPEEATLKHEASADVLAAVRALDERHRLPVILRYTHDLPVAEISLLFQPRFVTRNNFGFAANADLVDGDLPSIERNEGSAVFNIVDVKAGEPIFDLETLTVIPAPEDVSGVRQLVVTGKIKPNLVWSDGAPLTAEDLVFTWQVNCSDNSGALDLTNCPLNSTLGAVGQLVNYEAVDATTVRATYVPGAVDPIYFITVFAPYGVIAKHLFEGSSPEEILLDERHLGGESANPLSYGPYQIVEWIKGDRIVLEPNPTWAGTPPTTEKIIYRFFADATAVSAAVIAGEIDASSGITGINVDQVPFMESTAKQGVINFETDANAASFEMLYLNYYDPSDPTFQTPHPVLGDYAVRKAIALALNRQQMVDTIFFGGSAVVGQPQLPQMMSYDPAAGELTFNPDEAVIVLEEAGWVDSDGDGTREKDGVRAAVNYITTSGSTPRQRAAQIIQASLGEIGIEVTLNFQPSSVVFSTDVLYNRNFDMIQFANTFTIVDPGSWWFGVASCQQIPLPGNNFSGANYSGWCQAGASEAVAQAAFLTLDEDERKALYRQAVERYFAPPDESGFASGGFPLIPLHLRPNYLGTVPGLNGPALDSTEFFTWNSNIWSLRATVD